MATIFYLRNTDIGVNTYGTGTTGAHASISPGTSNVSVASTTTGADQLILYFTSKAVIPFTLAGTITVNLYGDEQIATVNAGFKVIVSKLSGGVLTTVATITTAELSTTTDSLITATGTPTSTSFASGDQIVFGVYITAVGGTLASNRTVNFYYNNSGTYNSYVQLTENIVFKRKAISTT